MENKKIIITQLTEPKKKKVAPQRKMCAYQYCSCKSRLMPLVGEKRANGKNYHNDGKWRTMHKVCWKEYNN